MAFVVDVAVVSVSESLVDCRDKDDRRVFAVDERWLGIPEDGGLTIGIKCSLACGSKLVARCMHEGVNGCAVECSAIGALRRSGTWCCISVENRMGLACGVGSVLMSNWISVLPGFLRGNVLDLSTISARLVFTPDPMSWLLASDGRRSGARTGLITLVAAEGTTLPEIERPLAPNGTGGLRMPSKEETKEVIASHEPNTWRWKQWRHLKRQQRSKV